MDISILYKDRDIIVCIKPVGISSEEDGMPKALGEVLKEQGENPDIFPVHRLDMAVGGVMVFARSQKSAARLSAIIAEHNMKKEYLAVIKGEPSEKSGIFKDLLFKDSRKNKSYVVSRMRKGVKEAELSYEVLSTAEYKDSPVSLVRISLKTGRSHQIRVQFSSRKMPLLGDGKYGSTVNCNIALWSESLTFSHPFSKKELSFSAHPQNTFPWDLFNNEKKDSAD